MSPDTKDLPFQQQFKLFAGFDWASDHHDVVAVDHDGHIVLELTIEDTARKRGQECSVEIPGSGGGEGGGRGAVGA